MEKPASKRLNTHVARTLGLSRREADEMIAAGRATINGTTAPLGARFVDSDQLSVDGKVIPATAHHPTYLLFHKPAGYVCSRKRQGATPTIYELLPAEYYPLKPVGRLDKDSSGLLLLSDDGDFAHRMTHPKFHKTKEYEVSLDQPLQPLHRQMISDFGVMLDDGKSQFALERLTEGDDKAWRVTMSEGRNRQIRRTFAALGYTVIRLHRTKFGNYSLGDIPQKSFKRTDIS